MTYLVLDFEALCHKQSSPLPTEVAVCRIYEQGIVCDEPFFSELIQPKQAEPTSYDVELTGITPEMLRNARRAEDVFTDLNTQCSELPEFRVIAHNAKFDRGIALRYATYLPHLVAHPWIDTIHVAKRKLLLPSYSLDPLTQALHLEITGRRHRAYPDAHITARAFVALQTMPDRSHVQGRLF